MEKRQFKNTDEYVSLLGFGLLRPPLKDGKINGTEWLRMTDYAIENGINYFDTNCAYQNGRGESLIGEIVRKHGRNKIIIATKMPMYKVKTSIEIEELFFTQLKRLATDYIDYYLFHAVKSSNWANFKKSGLYDFLLTKKKEGKIRHIGFSFHDKPELLTEIVNEYDWDFAQIQLNYMDWTLQNAKEQYNILKDKSLPIIVMEPVRGGTLAMLCQESLEIFNDANPNVSTASWAIRYAASFPEVLCVLSGMSNMDQVVDNVTTFKNFKLIDESEYAVIQKALNVYLKMGDIPCTGCQYCIECPKNIDIPTIFSIYNIYLHKNKGNLDNGRTSESNFLFSYGIIPKTRTANLCVNCGLCINHCPQHIDIPANLMKVIQKVKELQGERVIIKVSPTNHNPVEDKERERIMFEGINFNKIRNNSIFFKMRYYPEFIEFFRIGKHCLGTPPKGENRWVYFPLTESLEKGKKYRLEYEVKSTKAMKRVFFLLSSLLSGSNTQTLDIQITADEWINSNLEFTADIDNINNICITATDLPVAASAFFIRSLKILKEDRFLKNSSVYDLQQRPGHAEQRANGFKKESNAFEERAKNAERQVGELTQALDSINRSVSFKVGRMLTFIPRKIRDIFSK